MASPFVRQTRSQRVFSAWGAPIPADPSFDFLAGLHSAMVASEEHFRQEELQDPNLETATPTTATDLPLEEPAPSRSRKARAKAAGHERRKRKKREMHRVDPQILERFPEKAPLLSVKMAFADAKVASTGFVALNRTEESHRVYTLEEILAPPYKFTHQKWNGREPRLILDKNNIICAILAGHPAAPDWPTLVADGANALENARIRSSVQPTTHRRGSFATFRDGISHGGGQRFPMNLVNNKSTQRIIAELNSMECFTRAVNFASAVLARRAPALHEHYANTLQRLEEKDSTLRRPFPGSVFAAATYNLGPQTVCYVHQDPGNAAYGMCTVMPYGNFDPTKGGHLILWDCRVVVEFSAGSTILLPSAVIAHSNCTIGPNETRYSFTQYSAGALFRWVNNGFQRSVDFYASLNPEELRQEEEKREMRWSESLQLLPKVEASVVDDEPDSQASVVEAEL